MAEGSQRLFIAVPLPPEPLEACRRLLETVRRAGPARGVRWVRTENLHLTLRFLGATDPDQVSPIEDAIRAAVARRTPFPVELAGAGSFPAARRPRALWIGIEQGVDELTQLARQVDAALVPIGLEPETRPFRAHLTVARTDAANGAEGAALASALVKAADSWGTSFEVDRIVLYRSHLSAGPPRYEELASFALPA